MYHTFYIIRGDYLDTSLDSYCETVCPRYSMFHTFYIIVGDYLETVIVRPFSNRYLPEDSRLCLKYKRFDMCVPSLFISFFLYFLSLF